MISYSLMISLVTIGWVQSVPTTTKFVNTRIKFSFSKQCTLFPTSSRKRLNPSWVMTGEKISSISPLMANCTKAYALSGCSHSKFLYKHSYTSVWRRDAKSATNSGDMLFRFSELKTLSSLRMGISASVVGVILSDGVTRQGPTVLHAKALCCAFLKCFTEFLGFLIKTFNWVRETDEKYAVCIHGDDRLLAVDFRSTCRLRAKHGRCKQWRTILTVSSEAKDAWKLKKISIFKQELDYIRIRQIR